MGNYREDYKDRRIWERYGCTVNLKAIFSVDRREESGQQEVKLRDLSMMGAQVEAGKPLDEGSLVLLSIQRWTTSEPFEIVANVQWIRELSTSPKGYSMGLIFVQLDIKARESLAKLLEELKRRKK